MDPFITEDYSYPYTGPLRAIYPVESVPKRVLPDSIVKPDYASNSTYGVKSSDVNLNLTNDPLRLSPSTGEGKSFIEQAHRSQSVGDCLTKKEQKGMREVCRVSRIFLPTPLGSPTLYGRPGLCRARNRAGDKSVIIEWLMYDILFPQLGREVLDLAAAALRPGVTTLEIDEIVHNACIERGAYPSPLGYYKFPRSVCT